MPLPSSATQTIAAGAVTATVTGTFAAAYQVLVAPAWNTSYLVSGKVINSPSSVQLEVAKAELIKQAPPKEQ
jgi:hypothetical protein